MKKVFLVIVFLSLIFDLLSQGIIRGTVMDKHKELIPFANVTLKKTSDSSVYKIGLSNENGEFLFEQISIGDYFIEILNIGYEKRRVNEISITKEEQEINFRCLYIKNSGISLEAVTVIADKVFISRKFDKTTVDIENSIVNNGSSAMEVLEKLPSIQVNQDGGIKLNGKEGVNVMINGKQTYMSQTDLSAMLQSMPSNNIQKIEIIGNPTANYDAIGNAGIINIITKRNGLEGFNSSVRLNYGQGRYARTSNGITFSFKNSLLNFYFGFNYGYRNNFNSLAASRNFYNNDFLTGKFQTISYLVQPLNSYNPNFVIDYMISQKTSLSFLSNSNFNFINPVSTNHTNMFDGNLIKIGSYDFTQRSKEKAANYSLNLQLKHDFDSTGTKQVKLDFDHSRFRNKNYQYFNTENFDNFDGLINENVLIGYPKKNLTVYSAKIDYTQKLFNFYLIETGLKSSIVNADYDLKYYNFISENFVLDSAISNHFTYYENINSSYLNLRYNSEKIIISSGVRMEQTIIRGIQIFNKKEFNQNYIKFFPTVLINYKFTDNHSISLTTNKRIDRPSYENLNPFRKLLDVKSIVTGNPNLLPETSLNLEMKYAYRNTYFFALGYTNGENKIQKAFLADGEDGNSILMPININKFQSYNFNLSFSKQVSRSWLIDNSFLVYFNNYKGNINSYSFDNSRISFNFSINNKYNINDDFSAELNFFYNYQDISGFTLLKSQNNLSFGFQKLVFKKQGSLAINISDLFWKSFPRAEVFTGEIKETFVSKRDTRILNLTFNYKFGNGKGKKTRKDGGLIEENQRAGGI